jgi:hypothetical protein
VALGREADHDGHATTLADRFPDTVGPAVRAVFVATVDNRDRIA